MNDQKRVRLVILNKLEDTFDFFDIKTRQFVGSVAVPAHPHEMALSADGRFAYASIYGDGVYGNNVHPGHEIAVADLVTMQSLGTIDVHPYLGPHGIAVHPDGSLWVTCDESNVVVVIDPHQRSVVEVVEMGTHGGHFIAMTVDGSKAYVSNKDTSFLNVIDTRGRRVAKRIDVTDGGEGLSLSPDGTRLYVMSHMGSPLPNPNRPRTLAFYVIDAVKDTLLQTVELPNLPELPLEVDKESRIRVTLDGKYLLISAFKWNTLSIVDAATLQSLKTLIVGAGPMNFAFPPDEPSTVYLTNHGAGEVSKIDLKEFSVVQTFPSTPAPRRGKPESLAFYQIGD